MKIKNFLLLFLILYSTLFYSQIELNIVDNQLNPIEFKLIGNNGSIIKSNEGKISLGSYEMKIYHDEIFTLIFTNDLAYILYLQDLYYDRGYNVDDKCIKNNKIVLNKLTQKKYYLRRKKNKLNDN